MKALSLVLSHMEDMVMALPFSIWGWGGGRVLEGEGSHRKACHHRGSPFQALVLIRGSKIPSLATFW